MTTGRKMCETIVRAGLLEKPDGSSLSWQEIWNSSASGELYRVFDWYRQALDVLGENTDG